MKLAPIYAFILFAAFAARADVPVNPLLHGVGITQHLNAQLPLEQEFRDEAGSAVRLADLKRGKPIVLMFVQFNCPSLCTTMLNDMLSSLRVVPQRIGSDFDVWVVSFDPSETPELAMAKKQSYLRSYLRTRPEATDASAGWHFLTGTPDSIDALTEAAGYRYRYDLATHQYVHPAGLIVLTPEGNISRYFFGIDYEPTDLRLSLVEASAGKIGTFSDKILLYCYHYDPATGKYGLAVANALRVGGALTIVLLATGLGLLWRADVRRTRRLMAATPSSKGGAHE
jgi:protein SCO1/2